MISTPLFIGLRYSGSAESNQFLSFISRVSLLGLVLGVVALTVVVSVMNGFDRELKYRILGGVPHVVVETARPRDVQTMLAQDERVAGFATFLERSGVAIRSGQNRLVSVYGIEPGREAEVSIMPDHMISGSLDNLRPGSNNVIAGRALAFRLGLVEGDALTLVVPEPSSSGHSVVPRLARLTVAGFFEVDSELDYGLLLMHRDDLAAAVGESGIGYRVTLNDIFLAQAMKRDLESVSGVTAVRTWTDRYGDFFETVRMEKIMMFVLLTLVVAIAAFNIVSGLSMMVKSKQPDIAVLRTLGLSPGEVMQVFVVQGALVGLLGTIVGMLLGIPLAYFISDVVGFFEDLIGARMLAGTYFDRVPSDIRAPDLLAVVAVSLAISFLATLYPAWRAARLRPANVLRYE